jgi:hypothetical protein
MKIACIFDNRIRRDTTGNFFFWALERLGHEVEHILPDQALAIEAPSHDFYLKIDDGLKNHWRWNDVLRPAAYYVIDTHYWDAAEWRPKTGRQFNWCFTAQKDGVDFMAEHGVDQTSWLPLAADEDLHSPYLNGHSKWDWSFVGNIGHDQPGLPNKRLNYLDKLLRKFDNGCLSDYSYFKEMANVYGLSKVVFNCHINNDINMRFFEGLLSGSHLLTEKVVDNGVAELKQWPDASLANCFIEFTDEDLFSKMEESIESPVSDRAREVMLDGHTYQHRCRDIIKKMEEL